MKIATYVEYYPSEQEKSQYGNIPAIGLVMNNDTYPDLTVFTGNTESPVVVRKSVPKESVNGSHYYKIIVPEMPRKATWIEPNRRSNRTKKS